MMGMWMASVLALGEGAPSFEGGSIYSYGGLAILVTFVIGLLKTVLKDSPLISGTTLLGAPKEALWALGLTLIAGIAVKALKLSFGDVGWPAHAFALLGSALGSKLFHDGVSSPVGKVILGYFAKSPPGPEAKEAPPGPFPGQGNGK